MKFLLVCKGIIMIKKQVIVHSIDNKVELSIEYSLVFIEILRYLSPKDFINALQTSKRICKAGEPLLEDKMKASLRIRYDEHIFCDSLICFTEYSILPNGEKHGIYRVYNYNNLLLVLEEKYYKGVKDGLQKRYYPAKGVFMLTVPYKKGILEGPYREYEYSKMSNQFYLRGSGYYSKGMASADYIRYSEKGEILFTKSYKEKVQDLDRRIPTRGFQFNKVIEWPYWSMSEGEDIESIYLGIIDTKDREYTPQIGLRYLVIYERWTKGTSHEKISPEDEEFHELYIREIETSHYDLIENTYPIVGSSYKGDITEILS